jgi:hypothetical protein
MSLLVLCKWWKPQEKKKFTAETFKMLHGLDIVDLYYLRVTIVIGMNAVDFLQTEALWGRPHQHTQLI